MTTEQIAMICHEANRAYCKSMGDNSQPTWQFAPAWQKQSAINGVNYHSSNPNSRPEDSHNNWLREKEADGWKYGKVKNPEAKEHPCFVPYDQLPIEQKRKDMLFISIIRALQSDTEATMPTPEDDKEPEKQAPTKKEIYPGHLKQFVR